MLSRKHAKQAANQWRYNQDHGFPDGARTVQRFQSEDGDLVYDVMYFEWQLARIVVARADGQITVLKRRERPIEIANRIEAALAYR